MAWFPALDFTAVLSALSKFSSLEERITDDTSSRAGATPEVTIGTKRVCGGSRAGQTGVAPALKLFCSPCFSKNSSSATRCIVTREAGHKGVQTRIFVRILPSTEIIRPLHAGNPLGSGPKNPKSWSSRYAAGVPIRCVDLAFHKARPRLRAPAISYKVLRVLDLGTPAAHPAIGQAAVCRNTRSPASRGERERGSDVVSDPDLDPTAPSQILLPASRRGAERYVPPSRTSIGLSTHTPFERTPAARKALCIRAGGCRNRRAYRAAKRDHRRWRDGRAREKQRELVHEVPGRLGATIPRAINSQGKPFTLQPKCAHKELKFFGFGGEVTMFRMGRTKSRPINLSFTRGA